MKKILAGLSALVVVTALATAPAKANNSEEVIIGVLGGALGGLILGEALSGPRYYAPPPVYYAPPPPVYYAPPPVYYAPQPIYVQPAPVYVPPAASAPGPIYVERCYTKTVRRWDPATDRYIKVKKRVCK